jgi:flagellar hook-associated protein 2
VASLFAAVAKPTDSLVAFTSSTADTKNGSYAVNLTQLATQGKAVGGAAAALTITAGANDSLDMSIDGVSASVTLAAGTYTAAALEAEIQSKVNGAAALSTANVTVAVTQLAGVLTMTSTRYGAASSVALTGGTGRADLFGTQVETAGVDVAGTIGGFAATGAGQSLTGMGDSAGLALKITGGSTGDRGLVSYARGYAYQLDKLLGNMLDTDSLIAGRLGGIGSSIEDIGDRRQAMISRLESVEKRLRAQFTALDIAMARMQQTSNFLTQQLASLPTYE